MNQSSALSQIAKQQHDVTYFSALGKFIVEYAAAEIAVNELAWKLSGLTNEKAAIIFGKNQRLGDLGDRIRQIMRLNKQDNVIYEMVDKCITHLDKIGDERNKLVHRIVLYEQPVLFGLGGGHFRIKNALAKSSADLKDDIITLQDIQNMLLDCTIINLRISYAKDQKFFEENFSQKMSFLHLAWQHKLSPPRTQNKRSRKAPSHPRRPPSSRQ